MYKIFVSSVGFITESPEWSLIALRSIRFKREPGLRGLRIPVTTVTGMATDGMKEEEILEAFPDLEEADIRKALRYAAEAVREQELPLLKAS